MLKRLSLTGAGSRASSEVDRPDLSATGDDETVVDADQGNGIPLLMPLRDRRM